jgi:hypothetical protein
VELARQRHWTRRRHRAIHRRVHNRDCSQAGYNTTTFTKGYINTIPTPSLLRGGTPVGEAVTPVAEPREDDLDADHDDIPLQL